MSYEDEDLVCNPVYKSLISRVKEFEVRASENGWILLIPQLSSLVPFLTSSAFKEAKNKSSDASISSEVLCDVNSYKFSMPFLHGHIIFPSPYLKQEYVTLNGDRIKLREGNVHIVGDGDKQTKDENEHQQPIKILFDEVFYNDNGSYKAFCTASPVISSWSSAADGNTDIGGREKSILSKSFRNGRVTIGRERDSLGKVPRFLQDGNEVFDSGRTIDEWMFVLNRDAKNGKALRFLESFADGIASSYVLVLNKVGIDHFLAKVSSGVSEATKLLITCNPARFESALTDKNAEAMLRRVLEAYLMTGVYSIVFSSLLGFHRSEVFGKEGYQSRYGRSGLNQKTVHILDTELQEIQSNPLLAGLHKQQSPLGKLESLRGFIVKSSNASGTQCSADYILSLLVQYVPHLENRELMSYIAATLQYMTDFIAFRPNNELDFVLTQFQAAVEFVHSQTKTHPKATSAKDYNYDYKQKMRRNSNSTILSVPLGLRGKISPIFESSTRSNRGADIPSLPSPLSDSAHGAHTQVEENKNLNGNNHRSIQNQKVKSSMDDWGGFLKTLKECSADVVTSSYNFN